MRKMWVITMLFASCKSFSAFDTTFLASQWYLEWFSYNFNKHFIQPPFNNITISWLKCATEFRCTQAYLYFNKQSFTSHPPCAPESVKTFTLLHKYSLLRFLTTTIITCWLKISLEKKKCSRKNPVDKQGSLISLSINIPTILKLLSRSSLLDFNLKVKKGVQLQLFSKLILQWKPLNKKHPVLISSFVLHIYSTLNKCTYHAVASLEFLLRPAKKLRA